MTYYSPQDPTSKTGRVWALADEISRTEGRKATRAEVVSAYVAEGGNPGTANVQYGYWARSQGTPWEPGQRPDSTGRMLLRIGVDGRVVIPAELRRAMDLDATGEVTARVDADGVVTLISRRAALASIRRQAREAGMTEGSVADELIAERRAERRREDGQE